MAADSLEKSPTNKRVSRAVSYVSDYWFPVNEELLGKIKSGLRDGRYDNAVDELVYEIKSDLSLFTYSIGKLVQKLKEKGAELNGTLNPLSALRQAGIEQLREILEEASDDLSAHNLRQADDLQAARFKEVLISASSAEMLAEKFEVDGDTAFSAAVLRQLGYVLIAWNYPGQYREAVNSLEKGDNLDFKLAERLGFSPTLLAIRVLQSWGLTSVSCASVGLVDDLEEEEWEILEGIGENVTALCKIGETLARASAPEIYPDARGELQLAKR
ncbi:MAG: HDOD domain-containing protein, partial [Candidatus Dadabacteria bacterium]